MDFPLRRGECSKGNSNVQSCHCSLGKSTHFHWLCARVCVCAEPMGLERKQVRRGDSRELGSLRPYLPSSLLKGLTPRTGPGRQPSLVSKGVGPLTLDRGQGVSPKKKEPPAVGIRRQRRAKIKISGASLLLFLFTPRREPGGHARVKERRDARDAMLARVN